MGNILPDLKLHSYKNKFLANAGFQDIIHLRSYGKKTQYQHCNLNNFDDPLGKIRPVIQHVTNNISKVYRHRKYQIIDEGMIAYKSRHNVYRVVTSLSKELKKLINFETNLMI